MNRSGSPTFVATFADGVTTRMTTWHDPDRKTLDLARGIKLSNHAYSVRTDREAPAIVSARFEDAAGAVLAEYDAKQLAEASS
jgi:hypothetical protein